MEQANDELDVSSSVPSPICIITKTKGLVKTGRKCHHPPDIDLINEHDDKEQVSAG